MTARRTLIFTAVVLLIALLLQIAVTAWGLRSMVGEDEEWLFWTDVPATDPPRWASPAWPPELGMFAEASFRAALARDRFDAAWGDDRIEWVTGGSGSSLLGEMGFISIRREDAATGQGTTYAIERRRVGWPARWLREDRTRRAQGTWPVLGLHRSFEPGAALGGWAAWTAIVLGVWGLGRGLIAANRERRRRKGRCPMCCYRLDAAVKAGCPECGWRRPA